MADGEQAVCQLRLRRPHGLGAEGAQAVDLDRACATDELAVAVEERREPLELLGTGGIGRREQVPVHDHVLHVREGAQVVGGSLGDALPARGQARDRPLEQELPVERLVVHVEAGEGRERAGR